MSGGGFRYSYFGKKWHRVLLVYFGCGSNLQRVLSLVHTVQVLSKLKKINATAPQPQRNVLNYFEIFKNVVHSLEPGETPSYSASHQTPNYVQRS